MSHHDEAQPAVYHMVAYQFVGHDRAEQVVKLIKKNQKAADIKVAAWAVIEVDNNGKTKVGQMGRGGWGTAAGLGAGALLGLIGGPAGLLAWAVGGAIVGGIAGKYGAHQFDADALKAIGASMEPNTSAIIVVIEDKAAQEMAAELGEYDAQVVTVTLGSQLSGEVETYGAVSLGEDAPEEAPAETATADEPSA